MLLDLSSPVGPLEPTESRFNHLSKLAFEHLYWHALLPGRGLPEFSGCARSVDTGLSATG
jgi:hypothetical protein